MLTISISKEIIQSLYLKNSPVVKYIDNILYIQVKYHANKNGNIRGYKVHYILHSPRTQPINRYPI